MTSSRPTIFIVEDSPSCQKYYADIQKEQVTIVSARSLTEANEKWDSIQEIALVVMDGCIDNRDRPDTVPLIQKIRETFSGPMIAASSSVDYRKMLMRAGCSHEAAKPLVPAKVLELLGLTTATT